MIDLVGAYSAQIIAITLAVVMLSLQPQFATRHVWLVAGAFGGLALYIALDVSTKNGGAPVLPILALVLTGGLLIATLMARSTRSRLNEPQMLVAVVLLATMVVGSAVMAWTRSSELTPNVLGSALGILPFAAAAIVALTISRLRRRGTPS